MKMKRRTNYLVLLIFIVSNFYAYSNSSYTSDGNEDTIFLKNSKTIREIFISFLLILLRLKMKLEKLELKTLKFHML